MFEAAMIYALFWLLGKAKPTAPGGGTAPGRTMALLAGHKYLTVQPFGGAAPPMATIQAAADGTTPGQWTVREVFADGKNLTITADSLKANPAYPVPASTTTFIDVGPSAAPMVK
jgi:hypothetical protein